MCLHVEQAQDMSSYVVASREHQQAREGSLSMKPQRYILMVLAILAVLVVLALQGCLFGGAGEEEGGEEGGEAPEAGMAEGLAEGPPGEGMPAAGEGEGLGPPTEGAGTDAASLVAAGMKAKHAGDLDTALQKFEAVVAADPNSIDAHWGLAWVYAQKKMTEKAITEFNKVKTLGADEQKVAEANKAIARLSR